MLGYYLVPRHNKDSARGGIGHDETNGYRFEIGGDCLVEPEMVSFLAHMPEIEEFLKNEFEHSAIARMIIKSISQETDKIKESLKEKAPA